MKTHTAWPQLASAARRRGATAADGEADGERRLGLNRSWCFCWVPDFGLDARGRSRDLAAEVVLRSGSGRETTALVAAGSSQVFGLGDEGELMVMVERCGDGVSGGSSSLTIYGFGPEMWNWCFWDVDRDFFVRFLMSCFAGFWMGYGWVAGLNVVDLVL